MHTLLYKPNADEAMRRLRFLYENQAVDRIFASFEVPSATLAEFGKTHSEGFCDYPDPATRRRIGAVLDRFSPDECGRYLSHCGCASISL